MEQEHETPAFLKGEYEPHNLNNFQSRQRRIGEHRMQSLEYADPMAAVIGSVAADLMDTELQVSEALRQTLGTGPVTLEAVQRNRPGLEMLLRLAKQLTQISQFQHKITEAS